MKFRFPGAGGQMTEDKKPASQVYSIRIPADLYTEILERAGGKQNMTAWMHEALRFAVNNMGDGDGTLSWKGLASLLAGDEGIADLLYAKIAEKLRLSDIIAELSDFATHFTANDTADCTEKLRDTAARLSLLITPPSHPDTAVGEETVTAELEWKETYTYEAFWSLSPEERKKHDFYLLYAADPSDTERAAGVYFWYSAEDGITKFPRKMFSPDEYLLVSGADAVFSEQRFYGDADICSRIEKLVRYVARDENIGLSGKLDDPSRRTYTVTQKGAYLPGIPYMFTFSWQSAAKNAGLHDTGGDATVYPEVDVRWHYTPSEEHFRGIPGETPFLRYAVPENIRNGAYHDEETAKSGRIIKPGWWETPDAERVPDRDGYPMKKQPEVKQ